MPRARRWKVEANDGNVRAYPLSLGRTAQAAGGTVSWRLPRGDATTVAASPPVSYAEGVLEIENAGALPSRAPPHPQGRGARRLRAGLTACTTERAR